jgi:undecaprenyl-diphosphatase
MESINQEIFSFINAGAHPAPALVLAAIFLAKWVAYIVLLFPAVLWLRGGRPERRAVLASAFSIVLGLAAGWGIRALWPHPRPFMIGLASNLLNHAPESSFPSDHATFMFALGLSLVFSAQRKAGWTIVALGAVVGWARIYLGAHFPFDIDGGFLVAAAAAYAIHRLMAGSPVAEKLLDLLEKIYRRLFALPIAKGWARA